MKGSYVQRRLSKKRSLLQFLINASKLDFLAGNSSPLSLRRRFKRACGALSVVHGVLVDTPIVLSCMVVMYTPEAVNLLSPTKRRIGENAPNYICFEWITKITVGYGRLLLFFPETSSAWDTCILLSKGKTKLECPPALEENESLTPHRGSASAMTAVLVNLDLEVPDTFRAPPAPLPYDVLISDGLSMVLGHAEYDAENPKLSTKCEHHFHLSCILEWMERSDTCPICAQEMIFEQTFNQ
ncbi:hypothetical protein F383_00790 [Gossypium arboreum]|uniref:RING-type E3 ubiquitin transferase n=1 Tax=Gossypium arboreum TaxID=29729 RepID=A0A0B0N2V6_GOSAR|nr:hypothetical protein F383_00790 [Gossypium arboreum]